MFCQVVFVYTEGVEAKFTGCIRLLVSSLNGCYHYLYIAAGIVNAVSRYVDIYSSLAICASILISFNFIDPVSSPLREMTDDISIDVGDCALPFYYAAGCHRR